MTDQSMREENISAAIEEGATPYAGELIFTPSELDAFVERIRQAATRQALERAAKACVKGDADDCAAAIRALEG